MICFISYYAGHNASKIKVTPRETMGAQNELSHHAKGANYIMPHLEIDFNPNATMNKEPNSYEETLKCINDLDVNSFYFFLNTASVPSIDFKISLSPSILKDFSPSRVFKYLLSSFI